MLPVIAWMVAAASVAGAQPLTLHEGWLIEPEEGTYYENGVGSPTVAYDRASGTWVMYFETRFEAPSAACPIGRWGLGRATSPDGLAWTVDPALALAPTEDTFYGCVLAHPTVIHDGSRWRLWFKAQQATDACADAVRPWGCSQVTGVGHAESPDGISFVVDPEPAIGLTSFGFPSVVEVDGVLRMLLAFSSQSNTVFELWESISVDDGATWSAPEVVVEPGFALWIEDEIYNPALVCTNDPTDRFVLWAGGRDTQRAAGGRVQILTAGLGVARSTDGLDFQWTADSPWIQWNLAPDPPATPDRDWRHWDVVRIDEDYLVFFSAFDDRDRNRVGLAHTYGAPRSSFPERRISDRVCSTPEAEDTAVEPAETDPPDSDAPDSDTPESDAPESDTPESDAVDTDVPDAEPAGCGCASHGPAPLILAGVGATAVLARRRRR
jgi:hypothetical protein